MPWRPRLVVLAAGYLADAALLYNGGTTVPRRLVSFIDVGAATSAVPPHGVASRDIVLDAAVPLRVRLFYPCH
ncbi:hypothetical protein EJB05_28489, partial [Eragrostis curvula]